MNGKIQNGTTWRSGRTSFARRVRAFIKLLNKCVANIEDATQVIRASGSIASNYIEANESLGKKDFLMRIKSCRKEAKESRLFLRLIDANNNDQSRGEQLALIQEAQELMNIFGAIVRKCE